MQTACHEVQRPVRRKANVLKMAERKRESSLTLQELVGQCRRPRCCAVWGKWTFVCHFSVLFVCFCTLQPNACLNGAEITDYFECPPTISLHLHSQNRADRESWFWVPSILFPWSFLTCVKTLLTQTLHFVFSDSTMVRVLLLASKHGWLNWFAAQKVEGAALPRWFITSVNPQCPGITR